MEDQRKVDFKKYISKPVSNWYLVRIVFYIVLLSGLLYIFFSRNEKSNFEVEEIKSIDGINVTLEK
jgi:hypothetical protein